MVRSAVKFVRRGQVVELRDVEPTMSVLDYLRIGERQCGTKEGCNEGDCGACTVAIGELEDGKVTYRPVNSCIQFVGHLDGKELVTVEDLATGGTLHPVQQTMVNAHASQCGFCTPGFVMALFSLYQNGPATERKQVTDWLAGNLCRCTGYRPIVDAALGACARAPEDQFTARMATTVRQLASISDGKDLFCGTKDRFFAAPSRLDSLAALLLEHPDATVVAGATDVGLWVTKQLREIRKVIWIGRVAGFDAIEDRGDRLWIGAGATYQSAEKALAGLDFDFGEMLRRLGSRQVRAAGTVGGNIANGSPIGDTPPALIALQAVLVLQRGSATRSMPLEDYFIAYGRQDRQAGEFVLGIEIPKPAKHQKFRCYKISKRFDQDISAVLGAFLFNTDGGRITGARIAFGGMAATPKRARAAEEALAGTRMDVPATWQNALNALAEDFQPITDMRASAAYRSQVAVNLLKKALTEVAGVETSTTRVVGSREAAA